MVATPIMINAVDMTAMTMTEGAVRVALHRALKTLAILRERHVK